MFRTFCDCDNLRIIRFCGNAPETLRDLDPTDTVIICFYPANNPTWTENIKNMIVKDYESAIIKFNQLDLLTAEEHDIINNLLNNAYNIDILNKLQINLNKS